jgi:outer membrane protein assembly factor BamB
MRRASRWTGGLLAALLLSSIFVLPGSATPVYTEDVTDYGRNRSRTHYTPTEPEYPLANDARAIWEVPLGLSRSQPLVITRDLNGDGRPEVRIYHVAGDRLWALDGSKIPTPRADGQSVESYRDQLRREGFILWSTPAESLCSSPATRTDELLALKCARLGGRKESRPFASSQASYWKGATPTQDLLYVGFGHPASAVAIRPSDGSILGGYIVDALGDRGIVGAPLPFTGDRVVIGTTSGESYILTGMASGRTTVRGTTIGGRISASPMPIGDAAFIMSTDARWSNELGTHGYMMAYGLGGSGGREFAPRWPAAVATQAGIPGESAIDANTIYFADKWGKLYALSLETGEMLWCKQFPGLAPCGRDESAPAFINQGPGVDEEHVYFVFRNNRGPNEGGGQVVALNKATGELVWQRPMEFKGNTAPVPLGHIVIVGDTGGYVRAYDKQTGEEVRTGGYPLRLSDEPYEEGDQGERWWEPIGGTATQMTVAAGMMLVGVNSKSEERTVLKAYKLFPLPDLTLEWLDVPSLADTSGFPIAVRAVCRGCTETLSTSVALRVGGYDLPRQAVTFRRESGFAATLNWASSGPLPDVPEIKVWAMVDPANTISETNERNNSLSAWVSLGTPGGGGDDDSDWGSKLTD